MNDKIDISGYRYNGADGNPSHEYLLPTTFSILELLDLNGHPRRLFDLGCGNGFVAARLAEAGWEVSGVDPSEEGIREASGAYPHLDLHEGSAYEDLAARFGTFPVAISLEVVEHLYDPREFARRIYELLSDGGTAIISTPYHAYLKNLALAVTGRLDAHFTALWDHGHIKFWSMRTLGRLLREADFREIAFHRVGRVPCLAKSMIAVARKTLSPESQ